jgi:hypothetical protein
MNDLIYLVALIPILGIIIYNSPKINNVKPLYNYVTLPKNKKDEIYKIGEQNKENKKTEENFRNQYERDGRNNSFNSDDVYSDDENKKPVGGTRKSRRRKSLKSKKKSMKSKRKSRK